MSIRKAQVDFFSPMTGNYFRPSTRRDDLFVSPPVLTDPGSITDAFDQKYGVISDEEAAQIIEDQKPEVVDEVTLPVIKPDPKPEKPKPKKPKKKKKKPDKKKQGFGQNKMRKSGVDYNSPKNVARRKKAQAMAKKRIAAKNAAKNKATSAGGMTSRTGRGGRRGGSTGGSGASSKGGVSTGTRSSGSPSRGGRRGGSTGGSGASSKGGVSRGGARTNRSRSRRRCDLRCKFDISILTNMNLVRDDLADVAYFVRTLQKN